VAGTVREFRLAGSGKNRPGSSGPTKRYADVTTVDDVSFTAEPGRVTGFLGPNGAGNPCLPPPGQRPEASPARAQALRASLHVHDREYLEHVRFGTCPPPASCPVYWYDSSGNVTIDRGTEEPGPSRLLRADADAGGRVRLGICHDLSASLAVGLAGFDGRVLRGRDPS